MSLIEARGLTKRFRVPLKGPGFGSALKHLVRPGYEERIAVDAIDLTIAAAESVAYVGPEPTHYFERLTSNPESRVLKFAIGDEIHPACSVSSSLISVSLLRASPCLTRYGSTPPYCSSR
jgi:hypothetical protein